ncbi:hypothetical protein [Methylomonas sp. UP202]|uniref:hypothetical protein n=1 Tax=Methylomonas sp. UP202 TaxID=3040943 RepID=UPI00143885AD|nr:hypothetical protein [Methylomonas sp. UP202]NJA05253.1 hypothetical protein [Methylococcaceae bacterium WWC4]WGS84302.1 hypothetical protein QC632_14700 [Methylomonas sp. UP202]
MKFSFLYTIQSSKLMTGNGAIGAIESLDRPLAAGLASAASLLDFTPNNTIVMPDKSAALSPSVAALLTYSSEHAKPGIPGNRVPATWLRPY